MNRFYRNDGLVIDLQSVSCVYGECVVIDGVLIKFSSAIAFDIRKQFTAYKDAADKKTASFNLALTSHIRLVAWVADLIGSRIAKRDAAKKIPAQEVIENVAIN